MNKVKWMISVVLALLLVSTTFACGKPAPSPTPTAPTTVAPTTAPPTTTRPAATTAPAPTPTVRVPTGKVTYVVSAAAQYLDPMVSATSWDEIYFYPMFDGLLSRDAGGNLVPALATSWEYLDGGKAIKFTLRDGVKFHNGDPFTADDVKFSFDRMKSDIAKTGMVSKRIRDVQSAEVVDSRTVIFRMTAPNAAIIQTLGDYLYSWLPKKYTETIGDKFGTAPVGAGPYKFVKETKGLSVELEANQGYWGRVPDVKDLVIKAVSEASVRVSMLRSGEADIAADIPLTEVKSLKNDGFTVLSVPTVSGFGLQFDSQKETIPGTTVLNPFKDKRVRLAFNYAVDFDAIVDAIFMGQTIKLVSNYGPGVLGYNPDVPGYPYDPKKARALLEEANFPFEYEYPIYSGYSSWEQISQSYQAVVEYLKAIGVKAKLVNIETGTWVERLTKKKDLWPMTSTREVHSTFDPAYILWSHLGTDGQGSITSVPELDRRRVEAGKIFDIKEREKAFKDLAVFIHDEAVFMPIAVLPIVYGVSKRVEYKPIAGWPSWRGDIFWKAGYP